MCGGNQPGAGDGASSLIEYGEVSGRRGKISPIKKIENLRAELDIGVFCKTPHGVVLENRGIKFRPSRPDQSIASEVASTVPGIRKS